MERHREADRLGEKGSPESRIEQEGEEKEIKVGPISFTQAVRASNLGQKT